MPVRALPWATLTIPAAKRLNGVASDADKRQISVAGANSVVPLTYGQDRIGALVLNVGAPAPGNTTTLLIQVLWGFAGSALASVQLNGKALPGTATITTYLGTQTSADSTVVAAFAAYGITYTDTLEGYAYSVISVPQSEISTEIQVTGLFSGRKLYDPRKDSTAGGSGSHRLATPSTWEYSDCPALALGDFLRSPVYGASETVDWATVATTATANDALIGSPSEKRRTVGVTFASVSGVTDIAEALRAYAGCFLLPSSSGIKLVPDQDDSHVATYAHADGTIASIAPLTLRDLGNSPTVVEVIYTDTTETPWRDASAYAELSGVGTTRPYRLSQVRMPGVKRYSQARREAIERLNKLTLQDVSTQIEVFDIGVRHEVADIILVTHPIGLSLNKFRITEIQNPAAGRWLLSLIEHDAASYSDSVTTAPTYNGFPPDISGPVAPVEGLSSLVLTIYTQSPTQPASPTGGSYTFIGDVFVPPSGGWSREQPATTTTPTWKTDVLVTTRTPGTVIPIGTSPNADWTGPPVRHAQLAPRGTVQRYLSGYSAWDSAAASASVPDGIPIVGDTVAQYNNTSFAQERTWSGSAWALPGTVVDGSVLVNGTVTAPKINVVNLAALNANLGTITAGNITASANINITGSATFDGTNTAITVPDASGGNSSLTTAVRANNSLSGQIGIYGVTSDSYGLYGRTTSASGGSAGVFGYGNFAIIGRSDGAGVGVTGQAGPTSGSRGVVGTSAPVSGTVGVQAIGQTAFGGIALQVFGTSFFNNLITSTHTTGAPFSVASTAVVPNLNVEYLNGNPASAFQGALGFTPVQQGTGAGQTGNAVKIGWSGANLLRLQVDSTDYGATWPISVSGSASSAATASALAGTIGVGGATATVNLSNKPGNPSTNTWGVIVVGGTSWAIPLWPVF